MPAATELPVRAGVPDDLDLIVRGNLAMARETEGLALDPDTLRRGVARVLSGPADAFYRVAERDGRVAGQLMVTREWSDWRCGWVWWIQSVYVWPDHRRKGVYAALYRRILEEARAAGVAGVRLYVDERNRRAAGVYARLGMDGEHYRVFEQMLVELPLAGPTDEGGGAAGPGPGTPA